MNRQYHDECGIFAIMNDNNSYQKITNGLKLLQHRGHDAAGLSYLDENNNINTFKALGLVSNVFNNFNPNIIFHTGIGHVRYSTRPKTTIENSIKETQPINGLTKLGEFALAHNGNIPNIEKIKKKYKIDYETESDTIIIVKIIENISNKRDNWRDILVEFINQIEGVYCIVILTSNEIFALRDAYGIRPLCIGIKNENYCIASESIALQDYKLERDVLPGEIIQLSMDGIKTLYHRKIKKNIFCSFEYIYFMREDSSNDGKVVRDLRYKLGYEMGKDEILEENSIILCVPNTARPAAQGFANACGLEYHDYIEKKDQGRTFILADNNDRITACNNKFIFYKNEIKNKNVYLVDDTIVRGNTLKAVIKQLYDCEIGNIHLRITAPPVKSQCFFGIDIPTCRELIAYSRTIEEIKDELGVKSLKYLDIKSMKKIFDQKVCTCCFDGKYNKKLLDW